MGWFSAPFLRDTCNSKVADGRPGLQAGAEKWRAGSVKLNQPVCCLRRRFMGLLETSYFPILCINPFPMRWAGGPGRLLGTIEVCETNNWKELNLNRSNS